MEKIPIWSVCSDELLLQNHSIKSFDNLICSDLLFRFFLWRHWYIITTYNFKTNKLTKHCTSCYVLTWVTSFACGTQCATTTHINLAHSDKTVKMWRSPPGLRPLQSHSSSTGRETDGDLFTWSERKLSDLSEGMPAGCVAICAVCSAFLPLTTRPPVLRAPRWTADPGAGAGALRFSIGQRGDCFSTLEILACKITAAAGAGDRGVRARGATELRGQGPFKRLPAVCLG